MTDTSEFDWNDVADQVVQQAVEKVAIYSNPHGDVVVRQEADWNESDDPYVVISRAHALRAAYAILDAAGLGEIQFHRAVGGGFEDVPIQASVAALMASRPDIDWKAVNEDANAAGLSDERPHDEQSKPKDPTAAARQRRYRERKRNGNERDEDRDTVTPDRDAPLLIAAE